MVSTLRKLLVVLSFCFCLASETWAEVIEVNFYSQKIAVAFDASVAVPYTFQAGDESIRHYYHQLGQTNYRVILKSLQALKAKLNLNDWFYCELVRNTTDEIFKNHPVNYKQVFSWFVLTQSGYDVLLTYGQPFELYVYSKNEVYDRNVITLGHKQYISVDNFFSTHKAVTYCQFMPGIANSPFDFSITLPTFDRDSIIRVTKNFSFQGKEERYSYSVSKNFLECMKSYPRLKSANYFNVQISPATYQSLIPMLKKRITGLSNEEAVRYLLSFVRLTFSPKFDAENKPVDFHPMIAEETLYYEHGDCEGKSVLFYFLVKELVGAPMVALLYPNHINVAVQLDQAYGNAIKYNDALYTVCEPNVVGDIRDFDHRNAGQGYPPATVLVVN